ncbi:MAG: cytochrome c [Pseudorhodoplanes sp.]|nr:cytochrome c [Pseudorhodoplanes sp.]
MGRACAAMLLLFLAAEPAQSRQLSPESRGRALVSRMCGECHAIGATGASPHPAAPAFRRFDRRLDLDSFNERLREGLFSGHPDMPQFRFSRDEARAVRAYLRTIQGR